MTYVVRCKFIIYIFLVQDNDYAFFTQFHDALFQKSIDENIIVDL